MRPEFLPRRTLSPQGVNRRLAEMFDRLQAAPVPVHLLELADRLEQAHRRRAEAPVEA